MFAALLLAVVAVTLPAGFYENATIDARSGYVAGKTVTIGCAATDAAWTAELAALNDTPGPGLTIHGVTPVIGGNVAYIDPEGCALMRKRIGKKTVDLPSLGAAIYVLDVESLHMRGEASDGQTACDSIHTLPSVLVARWGFRKANAVAQLMHGAKDYLARQPSQYHSAGC